MKEQLQKYGLSEKEAEIYLACLKAGDVTANKISEITGIRRSTVYEVLEALKKKGIVTSFRKNNKYYFNAVKPNVLINLLKEKERLIKEILSSLKKLIQSSYEKPKVELFEGITAIKNVVLDMLNHKEILSYGASQKGEPVFDSFIENFARRRVEKKIKMRGVFEKEFSKHMSDEEIKKYTKIRTNALLKEHNSVYFIYGKNLLVINLEPELVAIKITSSLLAESQKKIFEILWRASK